MKKYYYRKQSFKLFGFITLFSLTLIMSSCGTGNDENIEIPKETPKETPDETTKKDVFETVAAATQVAGKYFSECNSISELKTHLDEIRKTEGVVDVWTDDQTMYVEYKEFGTITYYFPIIPDTTENQNSTRSFERPTDFGSFSFPKTATTSTRSEEFQYDKHSKLNDSEKHSLVIYNALAVDDRFKKEKTIINNIENNFKALNYSVKHEEIASDIDKHVKFFTEDIFNYDNVIINCHGGFDTETKKHWFITNCLIKAYDFGLSKEDLNSIKDKKNKEISSKNPGNYLGASFIKEKFNGEMRNALYWRISEDLISSEGRTFNNRAIVFNCACMSLMGSQTLGDIFCNKGAACYLGYDNINCIGMDAADAFFQSLLNGFSVQTAFNHLEKKYQHDISYYCDIDEKGNKIKKQCNAHLHIVAKDNNEENKHVCITHPKTESYEENKDNTFLLKGSIKIADPNNDNEYGFMLYSSKGNPSYKPIEEKLKYSPIGEVFDKFNYNENEHLLEFNFEVNKSELKDIDKFCAYMYDGNRYCLGDLMDIEITKAYAEYDSGTKTMTFRYGKKPNREDVYEFNDFNMHSVFSDKKETEKVVFDKSFANYHPNDFSFSVFPSIKEIVGLQYFNTSNMTNMSCMFQGCKNLPSLDLSNFDTSKVTDMSNMFLGCRSMITLDLSSFNTYNVNHMEYMFSECRNLVTIYASEKWTMENVICYDYFYGRFEEIRGPMPMFQSCNSIVGGKGTTYSGDLYFYARIDGGEKAPGYFTYKE